MGRSGCSKVAEMKDTIELFNFKKKIRKKSSPENIFSSSPKLGVADFSRFSMISLSKLLREIIENLGKSATPNFGELEKIFSGEEFFLDFFSVKELDRIFHFRYFRASTDL